MHRRAETAVTYFAITAVLVGWWFFAFREPIAQEPPRASNTARSADHAVESWESLEPLLYPLSREEIKQALAGDTELMSSLIQRWDLDAEILSASAAKGVERLERSLYVRSQIIGRIFNSKKACRLKKLQAKELPHVAIDSLGAPISCGPAMRLFPQTYQAAGILLTLSSPEAIVALPQGLRQQTELYPKATTDLIPLDFTTYNGEALLLAGAEVAIVSSCYSHPAAITALNRQGIKTFAIGNCATVDEIEETIVQIGVLAGQPLKAELLNIFLKAALIAIDNWRALAAPRDEESGILVVNYYHQFSLVSPRLLSYHLLERAGLTESPLYKQVDKERWSTPLHEETLVQQKPRQLIVITDDKEAMRNHLESKPALRDLGAHLSLVDATVQNTPSHYLVLAYYDLIRALIEGHEK